MLMLFCESFFMTCRATCLVRAALLYCMTHARAGEGTELQASLGFYLHARYILVQKCQMTSDTLAVAISKSSCVTCTRRSRSANMPASVQHAFISAPDAPGILSAICKHRALAPQKLAGYWTREPRAND